jgi:hypothetical protein
MKNPVSIFECGRGFSYQKATDRIAAAHNSGAPKPLIKNYPLQISNQTIDHAGERRAARGVTREKQRANSRFVALVACRS